MKINEIFYSIILTKHAQERSKQRCISLEKIIKMLSQLNQDLIDNIKDQKFILINKILKTSILACIENGKVVIITVISNIKKHSYNCVEIIF